MKKNTPKSSRQLLGFLIILGLSLSSCTNYFIIPDFNARTADHKKVAILPVEVVFYGNMPKGLTEDDILTIEEGESQAFQMSLYNSILASTRKGKKPIRVDIQNVNKTLGVLIDNGISIRDSWTKDPEQLAGILGVDAVLKARIEKTRFMSDLASYGIDLGMHVVNLLTEHSLAPWLPGGMTTSKEINASYALLDKSDGTTLWSTSFASDADWRQPANHIIDDINRRASKTFPYRTK